MTEHTTFPHGRCSDTRAPAIATAVLITGSAAIACRDLFGGVATLRSLEHWLFEPSGSLAPFAVAMATWLLWRRRRGLDPDPAQRRPAAAAAMLSLAAGAFVWGRLVRAEGLTLLTIATSLWAYGLAVSGPRGMRATGPAGLACLLAMPVPEPLQNELVWRLQVSTAAAAAQILEWAGQEISRSGLVLQTRAYAFLVAEECSGLQAARILLLVAIVIGELFRGPGSRSWWIVPFAPLLGVGLNAVRVSLIAASPNPAGALADHTAQGVGVLLAGTVILYAGAWTLARSGPPEAPVRSRTARRPQPAFPFGAAAWWASLAATSLLLPSFRDPALPDPLRFPEQRAGWSGEDLTPDPRFEGVLPRNHIVWRRYVRKMPRAAAEVVEMFATYDVPGNVASARYFTPKAELPGMDWRVDERRPVRIWRLGIDGTLCVASRPAGRQRALVYVVPIRDDGLPGETWRSLLALERSPFARDRTRAVVRLATPLRTAPGARDRARRTLDRFVSDFGDDLARL